MFSETFLNSYHRMRNYKFYASKIRQLFCLQIHVNLKLQHFNIQMKLEIKLLFIVIWEIVARENI